MVYRYCALRGLPLPTPKSPSLALVSAGQACRDEPDDDQVIRARRQHSDARAALLSAGMAIGVGSRVNGITFAVCIEDKGMDPADAYDKACEEAQNSAFDRLYDAADALRKRMREEGR